MALPLHALKVIAPYLKGAEVLSLGYPDLIVSKESLEKTFGVKVEKLTDANEWHGVRDKLPDTIEFFQSMGAKLSIVDFTQDRGMEVVANLNDPHDLGKFDLVIDPGTLEHCFNIGQAILNAANAVKVGGRLFHLSPLNMANHGFFNICPTMYHDFYSQNGWSAEMAVIPARDIPAHQTERFNAFVEYLVRCMATRNSDAPLKFPIQTKYLKKMRNK